MNSFRRKLWTAALALLIAGAGMAGGAAAQNTKEAAQTTAKPVPLTRAEKAELGRVEDYLNGLRTLQARFIQVSQRGQVAEGDLYLQRPGRVRFEYDPPVPILIVSSGPVLYYFDKELEQTTQVFVRTTPVGILVREKLSFADDVTVSHFAKRAGRHPDYGAADRGPGRGRHHPGLQRQAAGPPPVGGPRRPGRADDGHPDQCPDRPSAGPQAVQVRRAGGDGVGPGAIPAPISYDPLTLTLSP